MINNYQESLITHSTYQYIFTVFTPSYNRAHTLHRVFESLKAQTFRDFEWLIVDDGSTDNTIEIVNRWQEENIFPIHYIHQKKQGKHIAFNLAVKEAKGELFLNLDSDDACLPNALERFKYHWDKISVDEKDRFSAVTCLCKDEDDKIVGDCFPYDVTDSDSIELFYKLKIRGEKWGFHRTDVLKKFPFPEIQNQDYCPEGIIWSQISKIYKTRFVNEALRIYFKGTDQLTKSSSPKKHALGHIISAKYTLNEEINYFKYSPLAFIRSSANYSRFSFHQNVPVSKQLKDLSIPFSKFLLLITLPLGYLLFTKDRIFFN